MGIKITVTVKCEKKKSFNKSVSRVLTSYHKEGRENLLSTYLYKALLNLHGANKPSNALTKKNNNRGTTNLSITLK